MLEMGFVGYARCKKEGSVMSVCKVKKLFNEFLAYGVVALLVFTVVTMFVVRF